MRAELAAEKLRHERSEEALQYARSAITDLTEKLHSAQQALPTARAELVAERQKAQETRKKPMKAPPTDTLASGGQPAGCVRKPAGRLHKVRVVQTVVKPVRAAGKASGRSVARKVGKRPEKAPKPVRWW